MSTEVTVFAGACQAGQWGRLPQGGNCFASIAPVGVVFELQRSDTPYT
jgi:hypothetical protein